MDLSALNRTKQNILSIGDDITKWSTGNDGKYNVHFYYPNSTAHDHKIRFSCVVGQVVNGASRRTMGIVDIADESNVTIRFDKDGIWIDGVLLNQNKPEYNFTIYDEKPVETYKYVMQHFQGKLPHLELGSKEGNTRTWTYYEYIKVCHNL